MRGMLGVLAAVAVLLAAAGCGSRAEAEAQAHAPVALAVLDFEYLDTSGEATDQAAAHRERLADFMSALRRDLAASGRYRIVTVDCGTGLCISATHPFEVQKAARAAGAKLVLVGVIHKVSTLIEWAKLQIVDEDEGRVVFDRLLSFRGDNDEAWRRAESFAARQILDSIHRSGG